MHVDIIRDKKGLGYPFAGFYIKKAVKMAIKAEGVPSNCLINAIFTDDKGIHRINKEQRNVDHPTDVLSFPFNDLIPGAFDETICEHDYDNDEILLGDMVISLERCAQQGKSFGHGFRREIMYLTVHSVLHLLGYDHVDEGEEKAQMRAREKAIMGDK